VEKPPAILFNTFLIKFFKNYKGVISMATKMTEGSRKVFEYLKAAGVGVAFTTKEV
jgi:hypothetical protein